MQPGPSTGHDIPQAGKALPSPGGAARDICCAIATDSQTEAELLHSLLEGDFSDILKVVSAPDWPAFVQRNDVATLLLAFTDLDAANHFHRLYRQARESAVGPPAQVVMLCSRGNVNAAYEMCRAHQIFDYVPFWPVTHDAKRLPLALHRACDAWESSARSLHPEIPIPQRPAPVLQVLVVEDHPFQRDMTVAVLQSAGLHAAGASSADEALAMLETSTPDLILLDVDMPEMGGLDLLRLLKEMPRHAKIPVIMLTVMRQREMVLEALRNGAADFIAKPFDRETLLDKIRQLARPGSGSTDSSAP